MMENSKAKEVAKEIQLIYSQKMDTVYFHGYSMVPFLVEGDELVVAPLDWEDVNIGDIITFRFEDKFPTYRVIKKRFNELVLKPDNWPKIIKVCKEDVLGKVIERKRNSTLLTCSQMQWIFYSIFIVAKYYTMAARRKLIDFLKKN